MTNTSKRFRALVPLSAALAVVAVGAAAAAGTAGVIRPGVPAFAIQLTAVLTPSQEVPAVQAPPGASGRFDAVLFRSGIGASRVATLAGCKVVVRARHSGPPTKLSCGGSVVTMPAPGQWALVWRLSVSGLSGPATGAHVHVAPIGHSAAPAFALCGPCQPLSRGHLVLTADQARALITNAAYVNVETAANPGGEIRGQIVRAGVHGAAGRV